MYWGRSPASVQRCERMAELAANVQQDEVRSAYRGIVASFDREPVLILAHNDTDGISAAAILSRSFSRADRVSDVRLVGRGENPWSKEMRAELADRRMGGLVVVDLGIRTPILRESTPTVVIDHHVPQGTPSEAVVISGYGMEPAPTSSLLAFWCAAGIADVDDLIWLAALGIIGDMAEASNFPELNLARSMYGITQLRTAAALINQPRRSRSGDAGPALALLLKAAGPRDIVAGAHPETSLLMAARDEVRGEADRARKVAPTIVGKVALIRFSSACQVHPLVAQTWTGRLKDQIVIAANVGFRPGWVHFAARSAADVDLVSFLRDHAPVGADENYGGGHHRASGGALRIPQWNAFIRSLGFGREPEVAE